MAKRNSRTDVYDLNLCKYNQFSKIIGFHLERHIHNVVIIHINTFTRKIKRSNDFFNAGTC